LKKKRRRKGKEFSESKVLLKKQKNFRLYSMKKKEGNAAA